MRSRLPPHLSSPTSRPVPPLPAATAAAIVPLDPGLFAIAIGPVAAASGSVGGVSLPLAQVARLPSMDGADIDILGESGPRDVWLGADGGAVVVRAPAAGGAVVVSAFGPPGSPISVPSVRVDRLGADAAVRYGAAYPEATPAPAGGRKVPIEIVLHVERLGDRRFGGGGWVGPRGQHLRIEGFGLVPLERLMPGDLEYKGFQPGGTETPWIASPQLCGSRGRRLPLTGFAIRVAPRVSGRWDVIYSGAFRDSGIVGPRRNGEPCRPALVDDPLEALTVGISAAGSG